MDADRLKQSALSRGWLETKRQHSGFLFWFMELIVSSIIAAINGSPWALPGALGVIVILVLLYNVLQSPVWQRNEARREIEILKDKAKNKTRELMLGRDYFTLYEAACIKAGVRIGDETPDGLVDSYLRNLRDLIIKSDLEPKIIRSGALKAHVRFLRGNPDKYIEESQDGITLADWGEIEVSREALAASGVIDEALLRQ